MQYEIEIGGRIRQVAVTRAGDQFTVSVDGRTAHVNATRIDAHTMSLLIDDASSVASGFPATSRGASSRTDGPTSVESGFNQTDDVSSVDPSGFPATSRVAVNRTAGITGSHEVTIATDPVTRQLTIRVGTMPISVSLNGRRRWGRKDDAGHASSGPQRIVAPMPGKIVRVLVKPGDPVRARQGLVVIEAMKMENELRAARDGTVTEVQAREAMSVDAGTVLVVIA
jgi:biotin carboxyl carrier protein